MRHLIDYVIIGDGIPNLIKRVEIRARIAVVHTTELARHPIA